MAIEDPKLVTDNDLVVRGDVQIDGSLTLVGTFTAGGTAITSTAAELNILDNATVTYQELNALAAQSSGTAYETVAAAGNSQGTATAMSADFVLVTAADGTKGVILPVPVAGRQMIVKNNVNAVLAVYPNSGGAINAIAADGALSMAALTCATFVASSTTQWFTSPLLPS